MTKAIDNIMVKDITGQPIKVADIDEDGKIVWENEEKQIPVEVKANVGDLLKAIILNIPKELQAQNDSVRGASLWNSADKHKKNKAGGKIVVHDKVYEWYHRVLNREIPVSKEAKDANIKPRSIAIRLWGISSDVVVEQLKDIDEKKTLDKLLEELGDED